MFDLNTQIMTKIVVLTSIVAFLLQANLTDRVKYLEGTWQIQGKEVFEEWNATPDGALEGRSYKLNAMAEQVVMETSEDLRAR